MQGLSLGGVGFRGVDFVGLSLGGVDFAHACLPTACRYVHRVGRTARLGQRGDAVLFLLPRWVHCMGAAAFAVPLCAFPAHIGQLLLPMIGHVLLLMCVAPIQYTLFSTGMCSTPPGCAVFDVHFMCLSNQPSSPSGCPVQRARLCAASAGTRRGAAGAAGGAAAQPCAGGRSQGGL